MLSLSLIPRLFLVGVGSGSRRVKSGDEMKLTLQLQVKEFFLLFWKCLLLS